MVKECKKVCCVIVTYGDRSHFLREVIFACLSENIKKIFIVDNNSSVRTKKFLSKIKKNNKIRVIELNENLGSAGGYGKGMEEATKDNDCEFIWLLDDDNKPKDGSLKILCDYWDKLNISNKREFLALLAYRKDRIIYKESIMRNNPFFIIGRNNSFLGFHFFDIPKKIFRHFKRLIGRPMFKEKDVRYGEIAIAPYGGLFFHKNLVNNIGLPIKEFFVGIDDHEWSYRITKNNGKIVLILDSEIEDLEKSDYLKYKTRSPFFRILVSNTNERTYFAVRNKIFFEQQFITNKIIYNFNKFLFLLILSFYKNKNPEKYNIIKKAIRDGLDGKFIKNVEK